MQILKTCGEEWQAMSGEIQEHYRQHAQLFGLVKERAAVGGGRRPPPQRTATACWPRGPRGKKEQEEQCSRRRHLLLVVPLLISHPHCPLQNYFLNWYIDPNLAEELEKKHLKMHNEESQTDAINVNIHIFGQVNLGAI